MKLLAIETSSSQLGVAVLDEAKVLASYEVLAERVHAVELPQALTRVLQESDSTLEQLDGVAVDIGPGSFTGLRIGIAFVKALLFRFKKPLVGVPSLDVLASNAALSPDLICPIVDAKQRKVYAALYRGEAGLLKKQSDYHLLSVDELIPELLRGLTPKGSDPEGSVLFVGDGIALYEAVLKERLGDRARFAAPDLWLPRAATLGRLGLERLRQGRTDDPARLTPLYLYPMDCTIRPELRVSPSSSSRAVQPA
ncbi:MAG: tRNA (adenosine(37)-N6)-threonylcarbamoyltransferase complex dimerization subunit type 1 TsaB [Candidatus Omnitrophica bacterium]|nr:tRNA (adenosine(37)-N6)-threonylcarbamoyltransferase complex dimerization subunit type 1 TsaB [Candidatus Omnitrophota bacterium]